MRQILPWTLIVGLTACGGRPGSTAPSGVPAPPDPGAPSGNRVLEITFAADAAACPALPEQARTRTYTATLAAGASTAILTGARFVPASVLYSTWNILYTKFARNSVDIWFQDPPIWEALSDESYLVIYGDAHGELGGDTLTFPFWARFEYCSEREPDGYPECEVPAATCESKFHQLTLQMK